MCKPWPPRPLPPVGDGNEEGTFRPPALPGGAVGETCELNPGKNPGGYGGGGRGGGAGCARECRACEEMASEGSVSDRVVNVPKVGDVADPVCSSTLGRFRGFGDCGL
jgi:hypothetical protein